MRRLLLLALLVAGCGSAREVPDVRGMTVPAAQQALKDAGLRAEIGTTLVRSAGGHFVPGPQGTRVTNQRWDARDHVREGDVVALSTDRRAGLLPATWERFAYRDGLVALSGLHSCVDPDHVVLLPAIDGVRVVELVGRRAARDCPKRVVFDPGPGWSKATIAAPGFPDTPAPELDQQRQDARIVSRALLPDRRTALVQYETGGCHNLAVARATLSGRTVELTILEGTDESDQACPMVAWYGFVLVRLPTPAPPNITFIHTRCGHEQQPACPRS